MTRTQTLPRLLTSGEIARRLREPIHRVLRVLATRPDIEPTAYASHVRLYDQRALRRVRHELAAIDARRTDHRSGGVNE